MEDRIIDINFVNERFLNSFMLMESLMNMMPLTMIL